jgi:hypothetical protein
MLAASAVDVRVLALSGTTMVTSLTRTFHAGNHG